MENQFQKENKLDSLLSKVAGENKGQSLSLDNRKLLTLNGVLEVVSAQNNTCIIKTNMGVLSVAGADLRVERLVLEQGLLVLVGQINALKYSGGTEKKNFFARLFK